VNCQALIEKFLYDYHAGTLSTGKKLEFELHLTLCRACRRYVDSYKKTIKLAKEGEVPPEAGGEPPAELVEAILAVSRRKREAGGDQRAGSAAPS